MTPKAASNASSSAGGPQRILLVMLHPGYVRNYADALEVLLGRGHKIHLAFVQPAKQSRDRYAERLADRWPNLTFGQARKPKRTGWRNLTWALRVLADFSRYLHPRFADASKLRGRAVEKLFGQRRSLGLSLAVLVTLYVWALRWISSARLSDFLVRAFRWLDAAIPAPVELQRYVEGVAPDVVLVTPHVTIGSHEPDFLKIARASGIRSGLCVASWDNLSNKGVVKSIPDRVFVWNEIQREEAIEMHGIPAERIVLTGAQRFDEWFEQKATWTREDFCRMVGLDPARPFLLYLCSSPFIAPNEVGSVRRIVAALREQGPPALRSAGVLIRPHPQNARQWLSADFSRYKNVEIWPRAGAQPVDASTRAGFFDSIYHSEAVVGVNTSAQIEAGIIGKTVHTLLDPDFEETQEGTLHFHYLLYENGGLLHVAPTMERLLANLGRATDGSLDDSGQTERFIAAFVRPLGRDVAATPVLANALEELGRIPEPVPLERSWAQRFAAIALAPLALLSRPLKLGRLWSHVFSPLLNRITRLGGGARAKDVESPSPATKADDQVVKLELRAVRKGRGAVILGPWLQDVTHELLYWIPFLGWAIRRFDPDRSRLIAVSRGGVGSWYRDICGTYVDALDLFDLEVYRQERTSGSFDVASKNHQDGALSSLIVRALKDAAGGQETTVFSPMVLRAMFGRYWSGRATMRHALSHLDLRKLPAPEDEDLRDRLPDRFVAAHFCAYPWFPHTAENRAVAAEVISSLAQDLPVVLLGPGLDDGTPLDLPDLGGDVIRLVEDMEPGRSLHAQSYAISRSVGFVGSHSGLSHLATAYGVNGLGFYSCPDELSPPHIDIAHRAIASTGAHSLLLDARKLDVLAWMASRDAIVRA